MQLPARVDSRCASYLPAAAMLIALCVLVSCDCESCKSPPTITTKDKGARPTPAATADSAQKADAVYVVRGQIIDLPEASRAVSEFVVKHEAIDTFVNPSTGEVVGMGSMEMPFPLAQGVSLDGLHIGDVVEITFEDYYKPTRRYQVVKVTKLPADTALEFRAAKPAK